MRVLSLCVVLFAAAGAELDEAAGLATVPVKVDLSTVQMRTDRR